MSTTRTGTFTIGFRLGWSAWQKDLDSVLTWAGDHGFGALDLGRNGDTAAAKVLAAGLRIGSVDLAEWQGMISADAEVRADAIAKNAAYVRAVAAVAGKTNFFTVMLPADASKPRSENFGYMVESFAALAPALEESGSALAIEGWPGPGALCCTPEGYRALLREVKSPSIGVNYDPSHLIRMGIDPLRFLHEFSEHVTHVHGKDTAIDYAARYEYGTEQPPTFAKPPAFGGMGWRYTIPGHGVMDWTAAFTILDGIGYSGCVCIELEDANFNGDTATEQAGLLHGLAFLQGC